MLQAVTVVKDINVPILGINTGRLGFLTSLQKESLKQRASAALGKEISFG